MNFESIILLIIAVGLFLAVLRYVLAERIVEQISCGEMLVKIITAKGYLKTYMPNEYPAFAGELEEKDTKEYVEFISSDVLDLIK